MRYKLVFTDVIDPDMSSSQWEKAALGRIEVNRWSDYCISPPTTFKMLKGPEGISVLMHTEEKGLRAECHTQNGDVYTDSCMEFFIQPDIKNANYFNFEFNPEGVLHLGLGSGRHKRKLIDADRKIFSIDSKGEEGNWTLKFYIPYSFLLEYFDEVSKVCRGNLYKCGDMTDHVHYGAWSEVEADEPDYHRPDCFGYIEL